MKSKRDKSDEVNEAEEQAPRYTPGRLLREARERRQLSREQLASQLKLSSKLVTDLEEENYAALPAGVFVRGYLNSFARHLSMDAEALLAAYAEVEVPLVKAPKVANAVFRATSASKQHRRVKRWGSIAVVLILAVLTLIWLQDEIVRQFFDRSEEKANGIGTTALPKPLPRALPAPTDSDAATAAADAQAESDTNAAPEVPKINTDNMAPNHTVVSTAEPSQPEPEALKPDAPEPEPSAQPVTEDQLVLRASGDSWTEVTDAEGKQLVYELLRAGVTREVSGTAPFRLFLGNAPAVALQYNGSPVPIPRVTNEGVARLTVGVSGNR
jgi:cytoskeleton protein RodZ